MRNVESLIACDLRGYSHEQLVEKLAYIVTRLQDVNNKADTLSYACDIVNSAINNTGLRDLVNWHYGMREYGSEG